MHRTQGSHGDEGSGTPSCDSSACMVCEDKAGLLPYTFPIQVPPKARPYLLLAPARRGPQPSSSEPSLQSTELSHGPPFGTHSPLSQWCLVPGHGGASGDTVEDMLLRSPDIAVPTPVLSFPKLACTWLTAQQLHPQEDIALVVVIVVAIKGPHPDVPRLYHLVERPHLRGHMARAPG